MAIMFRLPCGGAVEADNRRRIASEILVPEYTSKTLMAAAGKFF